MIHKATSRDTPLPFVFDGDAAAKSVADMLNEIAESENRRARFTASFAAPTLEYVKACHEHNATAMATLTIALAGKGTCKPLEIPVFYPYHGVFVVGNGNGNINRPARAKLMAWRPCLIRRPGLWFLRHYKGDGSYRLKIEFSFLCGRGISHGNDDVSVREQELKRKEFKGVGIMLKRHWDEYVDPHVRNLPPWSGHGIVRGEKEDIKNAFKQLNLCDEKRRYSTQVDSILRGHEQNGNISVYDSEDLATRRLCTYEVFLAENIVQYLCNGWLADKSDCSFNDYVSDNKIDGLDVSAHIRSLILNRGYAWMVPFACRTAQEAISCLTSFMRYGWKSETLKTLSSQFRQNHPSFQDIVCPVQTPESEMVGLALNLAKGVSAGRDGELEVTPESRETGLGYAASLIPFIQHNDAARASLGAKNFVQAMMLIYGEPPLVRSGTETKVMDALLPLSDFLPREISFWCPGINMLVAYMPWYGYNYNDAIVACDALSRIMPAYGKEQTFVRYLEHGEKIIGPTDDLFVNEPVQRSSIPGNESQFQYFHYLDPVTASEIMVGVRQQDGTIEDVRFGATGYLKSIKLEQHRIEWAIETTTTEYNDFEIGEKLTGRHGNKGVVSEILSDDMMPRLPVDDRLGELSGLPVMLVLNPHGALSRMNVGQLLESHVGLLKMLRVEGLPDDIGHPFTTTDAEMIRCKLLSINGNDGRPPVIDGYGRMTLDITSVNGSEEFRTSAPVVVGFQYFVRLDHSPLDKLNVRGGDLGPDAYNQVTGQPLAGRSVNGGQKLGRMEFWALDAYRANSFIDYAVTDQWAYRNREGDEGKTFHAIRDGLFALGIGLDKMNGGYRLRRANADEIRRRCRALPHDIVRETVTGCVKGIFKCSIEQCKFEPILWEATGKAQRSYGKKWLCFADILRDRAVANLTGEIENVAGASIKWVSDDGKTHAELKCDKKYHFDLDVAGARFHSYTRSKMSSIPVKNILNMRITCSEHTRACLVLGEQEPHEDGSVEATGGLSDPAYFGENLDGWGCVILPTWVRVRPEETLGKWARGFDPVTVVPVLPPIYRRDNKNTNGEMVPHKLNELYIGLFDAIRRTNEKGGPTEEINPKNKKTDIEHALAELYSELKKRMEKKSGLMRGEGLSRRVDRSGRTVAIPDPGIGIDECRLPDDFLNVLFGSDGEGDPEGPLLIVRFPTLHRYNIKAMYARDHDKRIPNSVVCVNPLICKSMGLDFDGDDVSLFTVPEQCEGDADRMSPTCSENLLSAADGSPVLEFEQDMVTGSYMMSMAAKGMFGYSIVDAECETCKSFMKMDAWDSEACLNLQRHLCLAHGSDAADRIHKWMRRAFEAVTRAGVSFGHFDLLECKPTMPQIKDGPDPASTAEIEPARKKMIESLKKTTEALDDLCDAKLKSVIRAWKEECAARDIYSCSMPGIAIAMMAVSGARGKKQIRQLLASRGYLPPGAVCFDADPKRFFFEGNLVAGMSKDDYFWAAMNGRSTLTDKKLSTADAGALTNNMVTICWPWRIEGDDCGNGKSDAERKPATCKAAECKRVCRRCYGKLVDGSDPEDGCPAGLIAAQSIGERGTQLSMKGFQTGNTEVDIEYVARLMNINANGAEKFTRKFREIPAYMTIEPRHFQMLWLAIKGSEAKTLVGAVLKMGKANVFNAMTGPNQWKAITSVINSSIVSAPDEMPARIMVGKAGVKVAADVHGSEVSTDHADPELGDISLSALSETSNVDTMQDVAFGDESGQEMESNNEDNSPQADSDTTARDEPGAELSEISIIRVVEGRADLYSVECGKRNSPGGKHMRMAAAFADILVKETPTYDTDTEMRHAIEKVMGVKEDSLKTRMGCFLKRTALYTNGRRIPLETFIAKRSRPER